MLRLYSWVSTSQGRSVKLNAVVWMVLCTPGTKTHYFGENSNVNPQLIVDHIANFLTTPAVVIVVDVVEHSVHWRVAESSWEVIHLLEATGALVAEAPWPFVSLLKSCARQHDFCKVRELRDATAIVLDGSASGEMPARTTYFVKAWQTSARHQITRDVLQDPSAWLSHFEKQEANSYAMTHLMEYPALQDTAKSETAGNDVRTRMLATLMAGMLSVLAPQVVENLLRLPTQT